MPCGYKDRRESHISKKPIAPKNCHPESVEGSTTYPVIPEESGIHKHSVAWVEQSETRVLSCPSRAPEGSDKVLVEKPFFLCESSCPSWIDLFKGFF